MDQRPTALRIDGLSVSDALEVCVQRARDGRGALVMGINADLVNIAVRSAEYRALIQRCDVVLADGVGGWLAAMAMGNWRARRTPVPDLVDVLIENGVGTRVYLVGGTKSVVDRAANRLRERGLEVVGQLDGYFSEDALLDVVSAVDRANVDLVLLGMPSPQKERLGVAIHEVTPALVVGIGGYIDVLAGTVPRAPKVLRRLGLEWAYRFSREPRRLAKRYLLGNIEFLWRVCQLASLRWGRRRLKRGRSDARRGA